MVISDAGHLMYLEKPAEFSRIVIEFLENSEGIYQTVESSLVSSIKVDPEAGIVLASQPN